MSAAVEPQRRSGRTRQPVHYYGLSDSDGEGTGGKRRRQQPKAKATKGSAQRTFIPLDESMKNHLFDAIVDPETSLDNLSLEWLESYTDTAAPSLANLVNMVLKTAGCEVPIDLHDIEDPDSSQSSLSQLEDRVKAHIPADYPLISKSKNFKGFKTALREFFSALVTNAAEKGLLYDNQIDLMGSLTEWLGVMSSVHLRAIRHTATFILLGIMVELCRVQKGHEDFISKQEKIVVTNQKKSRPPKTTIDKAKDAIDAERQRSNKILTLIDDLYAMVFANRYRDVDVRIRKECAKSLGTAMEVYPKKFLEGQYLSSLSTLLSDRESTVRLEAMNILLKLYGNSSFQESLSQFTVKSLSRFLQMAQLDPDSSVRRSAVELLAYPSEMGYMDEATTSKVVALVYDVDSRVRNEASYFLYKMAVSNSLDEHEDLDEDQIESLLKKFKLPSKWVEFKLISQILSDTPGPAVKERAPQSGSSTESEINSLFSQPESANAVVGESIMNVSIKEGTPMDWTSLADYLIFDLSSLSPDGSDKEANFIEAFSLKEDEKLLLLEVLWGCVRASLTSITDTDVKKRKQDDTGGREEICSKLLDVLPKLIDAYKYSSDALARVFNIAGTIDLDACRLHRREADLTSLLRAASNQFDDGPSQVQDACAQFFAHCMANSAFSEETSQLIEQLVASTTEMFDVDAYKSVDKLSRLVWISDCTRQLDDKSLIATLCDSLQSQTVEDLQTYVRGSISIIYSYFVWRLGSVIGSEDANMEGLSEKLNLILDAIDHKAQNLKKEESDLQTFTFSTILDLFTIIATAQLRSPEKLSSLELTDQIPPSIKKKLMSLFLEKERNFLKASDREDEMEITDLDEEIQEGDEDQEQDQDQDQDQEMGDSPNNNSSIETLDYDLSRYTSKLLLASAVDLLDESYVDRIKVNSRIISPRFAKVVNVNFTEEE
uniref:ARAD1C02992p n=1 Tax=Blastobotrys adeninivorans TaxID=409370 RepID=A0A060SYR0_BLAAD